MVLNIFKDRVNLRHSDFEITFYFIGKDPPRKDYLSGLVDEMKAGLPGQFNIHIEQGEFNIWRRMV